MKETATTVVSTFRSTERYAHDYARTWFMDSVPELVYICE